MVILIELIVKNFSPRNLIIIVIVVEIILKEKTKMSEQKSIRKTFKFPIGLNYYKS